MLSKPMVSVGTPWHIDNGKPGLSPRGAPMPRNAAEWEYLAGLYADKILEDRDLISKLKRRINVLEQRGKA